MTAQAHSVRRWTFGSFFLWFALASSLVFQGTAANLLYLALSVAALLAALVCVGPNAIWERLECNPWGFALAFSFLGYLVIAYQLSISPDNSFASSWALAAAPLAFVGGSVVVQSETIRRAMALSISGLVIALAAVSCARFVVLGERAQQPLVDPNNYATLMYLVWIPLVHRFLVGGWRGESIPGHRQCLWLTASFLLVLAIIATRSRTALLIVGTVLGVWTAIAAFNRMAWGRLCAQLGVVGLAIVVSVAVTALTNAPTKGAEFNSGLNIRFELVRSAVAMLAQHPWGAGVFCFPVLYPNYRSLAEQDTAGLYVHNDYVQFLVEGGVPLLALLLLFVGSVLHCTWTLIRLDPRSTRSAGLGVALALGAACMHAFVNFVFYSLPLSIIIGLMSAWLFGNWRRPSVPNISRRVPRRAVAAGITAGWVMWVYLALDVVTAGVFQGQSSLGLVTSIRGDEHRMLEYARLAQRINENRGIPTLGEAILLYRAARAEPDSRYLLEQTYRAFHRALAVDPWNTLTYLRLAQFLDEFAPKGARAPGESTEELVLAALGRDPLFVPGIDQLLQYYAATSQESKGFALLRNVVYPWIGLLRLTDPGASERYFDRLEADAAAMNENEFLAELRERRILVARITPKRERPWFS